MAVKSIDTKTLAAMFLAGAANLEANKEIINDLNVFPVPDGDTGTNMTLTIMSAAKEVQGLEKLTMPAMAKAISSGSLRGARGNSGVILSQLLRGFTREISGLTALDVPAFSRALDRAAATAYKAVMKPKEGTILTVAKEISHKGQELAETTDDFEIFFPEIIRRGEEALANTPNLLPVLKEAGVVDSGGQGLMAVICGAYDAFLGKEVDYSAIESHAQTRMVKPAEQGETDIKFGYCTEFIIMLEKEFTEKDEEEFKAFLESIGDSIVCVAVDDIVKTHVHTNDPGLAIQKALTYGQLSRMKIDNMREEHHERVIKDAEKLAAEQAAARKAAKPAEPPKEIGFIAVSIGEGMNQIFRELGADYIIEGGQTMNPSTEDMLEAIAQVNAEHIFILPNNKNIILAANQAKSLTEDKDIIVIPAKTVPQGITALIDYIPDADAKANEEAMLEGIRRVKSGQVTYAVRDTTVDSREIREGDMMGIGDAGILAVGSDAAQTAEDLVNALADEDTELISLYYGQETAGEEAQALADRLSEKYPEADVDVYSGGQPIYYYVLSVE